MTLQNKFDIAKKLFEKGDIKDGYHIGHKVYYAYMTNQEWSDFIYKMPKEINDNFKNGDGKELEQKKHSSGCELPPKMCSYGSSSRMLYQLAWNIPKFKFEHKLHTIIGGDANIDGYLEKDNIYIEAKCREIYGSINSQISNKYDELYEYISQKDNRFSFVRYGKNVTFKWEENNIELFDIKQIICHLLGIANSNLKNGKIQNIVFLYLVYDPKELNFNKAEDRDAIIKLWNQEKSEAEKVDYKALYYHIAKFLHEKKGIGQNIHQTQIEEMGKWFSFNFCTQTDFPTFFD